MGEPAFLSEEFHNPDDIDLELVATSGYGKNGAISILQARVNTTWNVWNVNAIIVCLAICLEYLVC